ncbi:MAG: ABC transporter permease [Actinobacteria bacterium]|nr:ABC transporter permease [Actinomycetota bacterium]
MNKAVIIIRRFFIPIIFFFIGWQIIGFLTPDIFWPSLGTFLTTTYKTLASGEIYRHLGHTMARVYGGWAIGGLAGAFFGVVIGESVVASDILKPYLTLGRFIPAIAWIGVFIIWFGSGVPSILALVIYSSTFLSILPTLNGMIYAGSLTERIRSAQVMGANRWDIFLKIKIPTALPQIWTGIRTALAVSFLQIVAAEMLVGSTGLGYVIWTSRIYFLITKMFVAIFMLGFVGYLSDVVLQNIGIKFLKKYGIK